MFAGYSTSPAKKVTPRRSRLQAENWIEGNVYESSTPFIDQFDAPVDFPFVDQYRAFPPRNELGMVYGEEGENYRRSYRSSENFFGVDERSCCDEWRGFCPCVAADYRCGCGGLKANPGHCLFKRLSSGEPCDKSFGCNLFSKCGAKGCGLGCAKPDCGCGATPEPGGSGYSSEKACGYKTATQRRCPLASCLLEKCKLKNQLPVKSTGPCGCDACQSGCSD